MNARTATSRIFSLLILCFTHISALLAHLYSTHLSTSFTSRLHHPFSSVPLPCITHLSSSLIFLAHSCLFLPHLSCSLTFRLNSLTFPDFLYFSLLPFPLSLLLFPFSLLPSLLPSPVSSLLTHSVTHLPQARTKTILLRSSACCASLWMWPRRRLTFCGDPTDTPTSSATTAWSATQSSCTSRLSCVWLRWLTWWTDHVSQRAVPGMALAPTQSV